MSLIHSSEPAVDRYAGTGCDLRYAGCGSRLFLGIGTAILLALVYAAIAAASVIIGEGAPTLERAGLTLGGLIGLYFLAAVIAGTILGLLFPLARRRWGAGLLGFLVAWIVYGLVLLHIDPPELFGPFIFAAIPAALTGIPLGFHFWTEPVRAPESPA